MRDMKDCTERLGSLVGLLSEMGRLDIRASISPVDSKPRSDQARLRIHFTGRDTSLLTADNGRVLEAIEVLAAEILELSDAERQAVQFDAGNFLADQRLKLRRVARTAIRQVEFTGAPHVFPPMSPRDRKLLGDALHPSGLSYETMGQQTARRVILFPKEIRAQLESSGAQYSSRN